MMLPTKFRFIWPSGFRGEDLRKSANQKQELPMTAMFVNGSGQNEQSLERIFHRCFPPSFTSLAEGFQRRRLKCEKLTDDRWQTTDVKWWQKLTLPLARWAKNVKKKSMMVDDRHQVILKAHLAFSKVILKGNF
jgi:hypothetical protein